VADITEGLIFDPVEVGDFDEVEAAMNRVLAPAEYQVRIVKAVHGRGEKAQYLRWTLEVVDAIDPEDNGFMLWHSTPIEGRGLGILTAFCHAVGQKWQTPLSPEWVESLYGLELNVEVTIGEWQGKARNEIKKVIAQAA
jgi:hypothetical protein